VNPFVLFPNPNKGEFTIRCSQAIETPLEIRVYDISGRLVMQETVQEQEKQVYCNGLNAGTYMVAIYKGDVMQSITRVALVK